MNYLKIILFIYTFINISFCSDESGPLGNLFNFYNVGNSNSSLNLINSNIAINRLEELDFIGNLVNYIFFDEWVINVIDDFNVQLSNNVNSGLSNNFNITVSMQWFNSSSLYNFENQQSYEIEPSTIVYSINVTGYQFSGPLNSLKLIIDTSLFINESTISTTGISCPYIENNNTTCLSFYQYTDHQYGNSITKVLDINDVSLYFKIFTNGIVDSRLVKIKEQSPYPNLENYKISLQVGLTIPHFLNKANTLFTFNFKNNTIINNSTSTTTDSSNTTSTIGNDDSVTSPTTSTTSTTTTSSSSSTLDSSYSNSEIYQSKGIKNTTLLSISSILIFIISLLLF